MGGCLTKAGTKGGCLRLAVDSQEAVIQNGNMAAIRQLSTNKGQYDFDSILLTRHTSCCSCYPTLPTFSIGSITNASTTIVLSKFCCHAYSGQLEVAVKCMVNQPTYKTPKTREKLRPSSELDRLANIGDEAPSS